MLRALARSNHLRTFTWTKRKLKTSKGLFGNELLDGPEGFVELNRQVRIASKEMIERIETGSQDRLTVKLFDDLSNEICCAADLVECVRQMHSDPRIQNAAEQSAHDFCDLVESINTRKTLYDKIVSARKDESNKMDVIDLRTLDLFIDDFQQSGVHLAENERQQFVNLSTGIFVAGSKYQDLCDKPVVISNADRARYGFSTNTIFGPISNSTDYQTRRFAYSIFMQHNPEQERNLRDLIKKRHELAILTGYDSYASRAQFNTILGSYDGVKNFLVGLIEQLRPEVDEELRLLKEERKKCKYEHEDGDQIGVYDLHYLGSSYKSSIFGPNYISSISPFYSTGNVMRAFERITHSLYGTKFRYEEVDSDEIWPGLVFKIRVDDQNGNTLGKIYVDIENRSSKAIGDCHYTVQCSKELADGSWQLPIVVLSLSFTNQQWKNWKDAMLSVGQAENLFHEMGHAMHSMLGKTKYQHVAGTRCPQDMAEIPSNLMEQFFYDPRVMSMILENQSLKISIDQLKVLTASRSAFTGIELAQQASCALVDLELHGGKAAEIVAGGSSTELGQKISTWATPGIAYPENYAWQHRFHHLVQYGARYYSYLVARSAASLVFNQLFSKGPLDRENGVRWAKAQAHGGGVHPQEILKELLGSRVDSSSLIKAIQKEVIESRLSL